MANGQVLSLEESERELLREEAGRLAARGGTEAQEWARRLEEAARRGQLAEEDAALAGSVLAAGLLSGRIRSEGGPHAELAASSLFLRLPQGRALQGQAAEVSRALATLEGRTLRRISLSARGPGLYLLTLETDGCRLVVALEPGGLQMRSLEIAV